MTVIGTGVNLIFRICLNFYFRRLLTYNEGKISSRDETHCGVKKFLFTGKSHPGMKFSLNEKRITYYTYYILHITHVRYESRFIMLAQFFTEFFSKTEFCETSVNIFQP